jgi:chondroitin AC lyase
MKKKNSEPRAAEVGALRETAAPAPEEAAASEETAPASEDAIVPETAATPADAGATPVAVDLAFIKRRLRETQLLTDPADIGSQATNVRQWMSTLKADGSWSDIFYSDQNTGPWKANEHLVRTLVMARLYSTPDHALSQNAVLRGKILAALGFWLARDFQNPNWWHNQLGVPTLIGQILILMASELAPDRVQKAITILQRSSLLNMAGANLTWAATVQLLRGALVGDPEAVAGAIKALLGEFKIAGPDQEGVQADFSFHQHGALLNSGGYGQAFTADCARFVIYAHGTRYAIPAARFAVLASHILDGQKWMMRGVMIDYGTIGRQIARPNQDGRQVVEAARRLAQLAVPRQKEFAALAARPQGKAPPLVGNRHFWKSDFMAHHRTGYYTSVRMVSTRTFNTDGFITNEARHSRHLADGVTYIFRTGEEYRDIFPAWDWRRVPGVTCEQRPEPLDLNGLYTHGQTSFVGGVSDGLYGLAAMDLQRDTMAVKKAWFYFDDQFICLGAGLTCPTEHPVYTSVNQCLRRGLVTVAGSSLWSSIQGSGEHGLRARGWVHHDQIGYFFPPGLMVRVSYGPRTGRWSDIGAGPPDPVTKDVFSVWIDHGARPAGKSFHYIVYPNIDWQTLITPKARPSIKILSNTATLQAVHHPRARVCGAVFHQPGAVAGGPGWNIAVDRPCLLLVRVRREGVQLAVANPQNQPLTVNVDLDRTLVGAGCTPIGPGRTRITVKLPEGASAGRSAVHLLKPG